MNSSVQPSRRIASNLLWTPSGVVRNPLVGVAQDGRILTVETCTEPDRSPFTEFWAGMLVPDFPADYFSAFARLLARREMPLPELLSELFRAVPVVDVSAGSSSDVDVSTGDDPAGTDFVETLPSGKVPTATFSADAVSAGTLLGVVSVENIPAGTSPADGFFAGASSGDAVSAGGVPVDVFQEPALPPESRPAAPAAFSGSSASPGSSAPEVDLLPAPASVLCETAPSPCSSAGCLVVISGLDYPSLRLTAQSRIRLLACLR